jgi:nucleoside-diphosphate-sugar epimerase
MRVFVAGASGVLGRRLVRLLASEGHEVLGLARSAAAEEKVRSAGGTPAAADLFDAGSLSRAAAGCDVFVHAATSIPQTARMAVRDFAANDRIRRDGTRALLAAARAVGARRFVFQSIVWAARPADGAPFDETSPPGDDPVTISALDGEHMVADAGFSILRCGWFYGADSASTRALARALKRRGLPLFGGGQAKLCYLHLDDAAAAFAIAAARAGPGLWHVVDDEPASTAEYFSTLATQVGAPAPLSVPRWLARLVAGREALRFFCTPMITNAVKFKTETGWSPRFPTFREGLAQVATEWQNETANLRA